MEPPRPMRVSSSSVGRISSTRRPASAWPRPSVVPLPSSVGVVAASCAHNCDAGGAIYAGRRHGLAAAVAWSRGGQETSDGVGGRQCGSDSTVGASTTSLRPSPGAFACSGQLWQGGPAEAPAVHRQIRRCRGSASPSTLGRLCLIPIATVVPTLVPPAVSSWTLPNVGVLP